MILRGLCEQSLIYEDGGEKNMDWCLYGDDKRKEMDRDLKPEYLLDDLRRYQDVFGEEFGVKELLMLEDIRVKAMIAGALADMPEFLIDQIGKASNSSNFPSMDKGNGTDCRCCRRKVGRRKGVTDGK